MDISAVKQKIEALAAEVSPNAVTPPMVANIMTDLADMLGETRSVMDVDVLRRDDGICLEFAIMNNETGKQDIVNVVLPAAEPTMAGLMSAEDKANADTLKTWYDAVSGNNVVKDIFYDAPTGGTENVCLKVQTFGRTGASAQHSVFLPSATAVRAGIMTAGDKRKLDAVADAIADSKPLLGEGLKYDEDGAITLDIPDGYKVALVRDTDGGETDYYYGYGYGYDSPMIGSLDDPTLIDETEND